MTRSEILDAAKEAVTRDRNTTHGEPEDIFAEILRLWSARLGVKLQSHHVAIMLMDLKTARAWKNPRHDDNWVDMAGYAACGGEVAEKDYRALFCTSELVEDTEGKK